MHEHRPTGPRQSRRQCSLGVLIRYQHPPRARSQGLPRVLAAVVALAAQADE